MIDRGESKTGKKKTISGKTKKDDLSGKTKSRENEKRRRKTIPGYCDVLSTEGGGMTYIGLERENMRARKMIDEPGKRGVSEVRGDDGNERRGWGGG